MLVTEFLKTIYLGDRACKSITIDGWGNRVLIQVDEISRVRSASGQWDYYNDENIVDGLLVFTRIKSIQFDPTGPIPNDLINDLEAEPLPDGYYRFTLSISSGDGDTPATTEVVIAIVAKGLHLENPATPGVLIEH
jgi:hypothetical protein